MLKIIDANNYVRRLVEADASGFPMRNLLTEIKTSKDIWVFVWDGRNGNERRRKLFPDYKMKRRLPDENIFKAMDLFREVLRHSKALQVTVPEYEADDVIASLVATFKENIDVQVHSTDRDLTALGIPYYAGWHPEKMIDGGVPDLVIVGNAAAIRRQIRKVLRRTAVTEIDRNAIGTIDTKIAASAD